MNYVIAAYTLASVAIFGYVFLHGVRRNKIVKEIEYLKQLD